MLPNGGVVGKLSVLQNPVVLGQNLPGHNGVSAADKALFHRHKISDIHIPGASSPLDGVPCAASVQGNGTYTTVKGQHTLVFQQDNAFYGNAGGQFAVRFFTG